MRTCLLPPIYLNAPLYGVPGWAILYSKNLLHAVCNLDKRQDRQPLVNGGVGVARISIPKAVLGAAPSGGHGRSIISGKVEQLFAGPIVLHGFKAGVVAVLGRYAGTGNGHGRNFIACPTPRDTR